MLEVHLRFQYQLINCYTYVDLIKYSNLNLTLVQYNYYHYIPNIMRERRGTKIPIICG